MPNTVLCSAFGLKLFEKVRALVQRCPWSGAGAACLMAAAAKARSTSEQICAAAKRRLAATVALNELRSWQ
jgi:hypothetical protein